MSDPQVCNNDHVTAAVSARLARHIVLRQLTHTPCQTIHAAYMNLDDVSIGIIAEQLKTHRHITHIDLTGNPLGDSSALALWDAVQVRSVCVCVCMCVCAYVCVFVWLDLHVCI
jgi:hypothetical protein